MLACGYDHSLALTWRGRVLWWGAERNGGHGAMRFYSVQLSVTPTFRHTCASFTVIETLDSRGVDSLADKRIVHASAGDSHSLVVTGSGNVWAPGSNLKPNAHTFQKPTSAPLSLMRILYHSSLLVVTHRY